MPYPVFEVIFKLGLVLSVCGAAGIEGPLKAGATANLFLIISASRASIDLSG